MAYLDRLHDAATAGLRDALARRTDRPVTFGWGPRFLHSTGQFHKGGPPVGVFLQITGGARPRPRDARAGRSASDSCSSRRPSVTGRRSASRGRPLLRLHLTDRAAGIAQLLPRCRW